MNKELLEKVAVILIARSHSYLDINNKEDMNISNDEAQEIINLCTAEAITERMKS